MKPPPHTCLKCGAGVEDCRVLRYEPHPYVEGGPDVAVYRCLECLHEGPTAHPELSREACAERDKDRARSLRRGAS